MPERGEVHRPQTSIAVDARSGQPVGSPDWTPYLREQVPVLVPEVQRDLGPERQVLPSVGCLGADYVFEQYAYRVSRRVETAAKSYVLGDDDSYETIRAQVGGEPRVAVVVLRLVGDLVDHPGGPAYRVSPSFRFRLPVGADGQPEYAVTGVIGWLVHHPDARADKLDKDWERYVPGSLCAYGPAPDIEVRLDLAVAGGAETVYAPVVQQGPPPAASGADVLPHAGRSRGGLFRRR